MEIPEKHLWLTVPGTKIEFPLGLMFTGYGLVAKHDQPVYYEDGEWIVRVTAPLGIRNVKAYAIRPDLRDIAAERMQKP